MAKLTAKRILNDIDEWAIAEYEHEHRRHLGASAIGEDCLNKLFLGFRWCGKEELDGRMLRLFQRGKREEPLIWEYLRGIGFTVYDIDPATGKQYVITGCHGHYGGSLDAVALFPPSYGIDEPVLVEVKTNATGSGFVKLCADGVILNKPLHFAQASAYGEGFKLRYAIYINTNKNDDSMHIEIVKLDEQLGINSRNKAEKVIFAKEMLPKIAASKTHRLCTYCGVKGVCHDGDLPERNCRSCKNAEPGPEKTWFCTHWNGTIPDAEIPKACPQWTPIVNG